MSKQEYNPKFKTLKQCQAILDNSNSSQEDKDTAKLKIADIKAWLEKKNQSTTKTDFTFDESVKQEIDQEAELIAIAHKITVTRYPKMSVNDGVFGTIVNATANRVLEIRKVNAILQIAQNKQGIVN